MFGITNWKTTAAGVIAFVASGLTAIPETRPYGEVIGMVAAGLIGLLAKDKNVTGGTISAATGAVVAEPVSVIDGPETTVIHRSGGTFKAG